jgi:hypothetical protein
VYSPWLFLHHVEGLRPDVLVIDILMAKHSWYLDYLDRVRRAVGGTWITSVTTEHAPSPPR